MQRTHLEYFVRAFTAVDLREFHFMHFAIKQTISVVRRLVFVFLSKQNLIEEGTFYFMRLVRDR